MLIQPLELVDLPFLQELQPPGWGDIRFNNQYFINSNFCFPVKAVIDNKLVGIGTRIHHADTAWLAMIIVHPSYRNKGIGKAITSYLVDTADKNIFQTIYLDATDLGYPVYLHNGFEIETEYVHYKCESFDKTTPISSNIVPFDEKYLEEIYALDKKVSGEDRKLTLNEFIRTAFLYLDSGKVIGAYIPALYDGLIIAENAEAGIELMKLRLRTRSFASVPIINKAAIEFFQNNSFEYIRTSKRMIQGEKREWKPDCLYNRISGALG